MSSMNDSPLAGITLHLGDCRAVMAAMPEASVDAIVTDPPYELGFMGKGWDATGVANDVAMWREALRVLKPGGHLLAFSGTRTYHRMVCAIEDAGFEVRDQIGWLYGSGFPKSLDVSKAIDKAAGAEREVIRSATDRRDDGTVYAVGHSGNITSAVPVTAAAAAWAGWGTALKPAWEPICVARKPLVGTVAANVLQHGTGALNIDGCRVDASEGRPLIESKGEKSLNAFGDGLNGSRFAGSTTLGRWPANVLHDGSDEVLAAFPAESSVTGKRSARSKASQVAGTNWLSDNHESTEYTDSGSPARFFYAAKASRKDRGEGNTHPTVKPTELMRYLCRLVTPPGGLVLDPFLGSGSTGKAAVLEGFRFVGCDLSPEYLTIAELRIAEAALGGLI